MELWVQREHVGFLFLAAMIAEAIIAEFSTTTRFDCGVGCALSAPNELYSMLFGFLIGAFAIWFPQLEPVVRHDQSVALWRRVAAFLVDLHVGVVVALSVAFLVGQIMIFSLAGVWNWSDVDPSSPSIRIVNISGLLVSFALLYCYFWLPSKNGRATVGQYIMGFQIVSDSDTPKFGVRPLLGFIAICSVLIWIWFGSTHGRYWWDRASGTRPIMVSA